jgi:formate dehydrogenase maturation protein FdhE
MIYELTLFSAKHAQSAAQDDSTCRICCDAHINAVFLECGHMAACMPCANRLQQEERNVCPICREPITRVVHVFRT